MGKLKIGKREIIIGLIVLILLFFLILFGITGVRTILGTLLFLIPCYLILNNFNLELDEKIIFSFFIGIGFFSTFVYWLGLIIGSLRISTVIVFFVLVLIGFLIKRLKK